MSKTIKEIADDLGYSKTYISQTIKSHNLQSSLRKEGNKFIIDEELEKTIKSIFSKTMQAKIEIDNDTQTTLQSEIDNLWSQLAFKDQQIDNLSQLLNQQQQLLFHEQSKNKDLLKLAFHDKNITKKARKWWQFWK
ncbi:TPA: hypothetical protein VN264_001748 [Streptococcus pyogenes]|nr:hypothetical protein [Streptococcus pyogenes]